MKLSKNTISQLRQLLANAAFNANNITIVDDITENDKWTIIFGTEGGCAELVLDTEDADEMVGKYFDDGIAYGYEYILQIQHDIRMRYQIDAVLNYIKGYVFMAARTASVERNLAAMAVLRGEVA